MDVTVSSAAVSHEIDTTPLVALPPPADPARRTLFARRSSRTPWTRFLAHAHGGGRQQVPEVVVSEPPPAGECAAERESTGDTPTDAPTDPPSDSPTDAPSPDKTKEAAHTEEHASNAPAPTSVSPTSVAPATALPGAASGTLQEALALRLRTLAFLRRVVVGEERFLYAAQLRANDYAAAVAPHTLHKWCVWAETARSSMALALQDTSPNAVQSRLTALEDTPPTAWDAPPSPDAPHTDSAPKELPVVASLTAFLAVLCALYAKLLACVDTTFYERLQGTSNVRVSSICGTVTVQSLLEPFPDARLLSDTSLDVLRALHHRLSVRSRGLPSRSYTTSRGTLPMSRATRPAPRSASGTRSWPMASLTGTCW